MSEPETEETPESLSASAERLRKAIGWHEGPVWIFPLPSVPWGFMFQRPHQMARAISRLGFKVVYAVDPAFDYSPDREVRGAYQSAEGPILFADGRSGRALRYLDHPVICWQYWPHQRPFLKNLPPENHRVYDCVDDLSCFRQYPEIQVHHDEALAEADVVIASATILFDRILRRREDALLVPNGVWYEDFASPQRVAWEELDQLRRDSKVLICYYGAFAPWFDWELVQEVARTRRDWAFLLVGETILSMAERRDALAAEPNVRMWPRQPYGNLGYLLSQSDVAILPFQISELTQSVSPCKLFEYMAGGKPVVSSPLRECRKYPLVHLAGTAKEFEREIEWSLGPGQSAEHRGGLQACAAENSWIKRAGTVIGALRSKGLLP
jgi:hypothetical protein